MPGQCAVALGRWYKERGRARMDEGSGSWAGGSALFSTTRGRTQRLGWFVCVSFIMRNEEAT